MFPYKLSNEISYADRRRSTNHFDVNGKTCCPSMLFWHLANKSLAFKICNYHSS